MDRYITTSYYVIRNEAGQYLSRLSLAAGHTWETTAAFALTYGENDRDRGERLAQSAGGRLEPHGAREFRVLAMDPADGSAEFRDYRATSLGEALTMAERADAGIRTRLYGVMPEDYAIARAEGIAFNEADGLLLDA
jgi:hypothetical protein